ncbi:ABC transporter ATP-binding protein [Candidimonas humi]|nr:ABC transporter ATP-binding protein [Candidimonas humi]
MAALSLTHVTISFGSRPVLSDISMQIEAGQFVGVLGPNGAGKSTLMQAILGLVRPEAGAIQVLGRAATRGNAGIGYVPQSRSAATRLRLRGWDLVAGASNGRRWGLPILSRAARRDVDRVLDTVGATDLAHRPVCELSGGQRQRLLIAQALLGRPRLLLLDEPLISLDPQHQRSVVELAARIRREAGITVLFSAHDLNPLLGAVDQVLYLGRGHAALGTVADVVTGPVLTRLYGVPIEVLRIEDRIFVLSGRIEVERGAHVHDA